MYLTTTPPKRTFHTSSSTQHTLKTINTTQFSNSRVPKDAFNSSLCNEKVKGLQCKGSKKFLSITSKVIRASGQKNDRNNTAGKKANDKNSEENA